MLSKLRRVLRDFGTGLGFFVGFTAAVMGIIMGVTWLVLLIPWPSNAMEILFWIISGGAGVFLVGFFLWGCWAIGNIFYRERELSKRAK